jgi:hypothetical protein
MTRHTFFAVLLVFALGAPRTAGAGDILIDFYTTGPNVGFADPTPVAPVGGNPGLTLGQQRIFVFLQAAAIWKERLQPEQDIFVAAQFEPLGPNVLGSAGAQFIWANFPGAELPNTWYFDSLADHLTRGDLGPTTYDIVARFSTLFPFYLGFDNNEPPGTNDLLVTVLHEIGHGLNFANAVNEGTGGVPTPVGATEPFGDIYSQYTMDVTTNKVWNAMTAAERAASAINVRHVSWSGRNLKLNQYRVLERGEPGVKLSSSIGTTALMLGTAAFGPVLTPTGVAGEIVVALDAADGPGPSPTDGCSLILNDLAGRIALIDRGTCPFTVKVKNAQEAGAVGVLIVDSVVALPPPGLGGTDPTIVIPSGRIGLPDGNSIKAQLAGGETLTARLLVDRSVFAGTEREKRQVMVAALNPVAAGSSISHFDTAAFPNLLMEPAINPDLVSSVAPPDDLSLPLLADLGWFTDRDGVQDGVDWCPASDILPTVVLNSCDSGVPNTVQPSGCSISDALKACSHLKGWAAQACIGLGTSLLRWGGLITAPQQSAINRCAR